ncbi:hypothetical protein CONLIGDRAFT_673931 [Coniochaeta ligniaria NRRL 30616]|uniref:Uncharacterized protein n=1 Tax=Coniochaeta ligniaria NRRL 30616 TaxID=1408157 RepID=A0A1J7J3A3_9PEZI|nr:hypothetical protein CONLIGDRAFT_673931 [Coniochaeta ligniaria NRRL 30616]
MPPDEENEDDVSIETTDAPTHHTCPLHEPTVAFDKRTVWVEMTLDAGSYAGQLWYRSWLHQGCLHSVYPGRDLGGNELSRNPRDEAHSKRSPPSTCGTSRYLIVPLGGIVTSERYTEGASTPNEYHVSAAKSWFHDKFEQDGSMVATVKGKVVKLRPSTVVAKEHVGPLLHLLSTCSGSICRTYARRGRTLGRRHIAYLPSAHKKDVAYLDSRIALQIQDRMALEWVRQ